MEEILKFEKTVFKYVNGMKAYKMLFVLEIDMQYLNSFALKRLPCLCCEIFARQQARSNGDPVEHDQNHIKVFKFSKAQTQMTVADDWWCQDEGSGDKSLEKIPRENLRKIQIITILDSISISFAWTSTQL